MTMHQGHHLNLSKQCNEPSSKLKRITVGDLMVVLYYRSKIKYCFFTTRIQTTECVAHIWFLYYVDNISKLGAADLEQYDAVFDGM